jgi:diaminopimelate epimerase
VNLVKSHAFGNDFLLIRKVDMDTVADRVAFARTVCARHRGIGADGLITYTETAAGASMTLLNADGSYSEVSGNGVRCLGAWLALQRGLATPGSVLEITTEAGVKALELLNVSGGRYTFRAAMGAPADVTLTTIRVADVEVEAVTLRVGNPQCVVLGEVTEHRLHTVAAALAVHPHFPQGTNVELAHVAAPDRVNVLIWERGVGPTEASGTGACAAAVAAIRYGGAARDLQVVSPGGAQRVEWTPDGLFLTGWAELVADSAWLRPAEA